MRMGYLDTMKIYGAFEGRRFTFMKGSMDQRSLAAAERAGEILALDSGVIYSKQSYRNALEEAVAENRRMLEDMSGLSIAAVFLAGCDALKKQAEDRSLKESSGRGPLGKDYNAAVWLIRSGLI